MTTCCMLSDGGGAAAVDAGGARHGALAVLAAPDSEPRPAPATTPATTPASPLVRARPRPSLDTGGGRGGAAPLRLGQVILAPLLSGLTSRGEGRAQLRHLCHLDLPRCRCCLQPGMRRVRGVVLCQVGRGRRGCSRLLVLRVRPARGPPGARNSHVSRPYSHIDTQILQPDITYRNANKVSIVKSSSSASQPYWLQ